MASQQVSLDLSAFKSAGVYTIEINNSQQPVIVTTQALRLVPGFSTQGPFNTPVFISSNQDINRFYGPVDTRLERKGSFFHRSLQTCLLSSPVFAINLLAPNETPGKNTNPDVVNFISYSVDTSANNLPVNKDLFINFFNRQRFWTPDITYLEGVVANSLALSGESGIIDSPFFQFANLGTSPVSIIVTKPSNLAQYGLFATNWYGGESNIPFEWIRPYDKISDYFVQIYAFEGDWTNFAKLSTDPYYSQYFNANGLMFDQVNNFINANNVTLVGAWTGSIIPNFKDQTGTGQYIQDIVNGSTPLTGLFMAINDKALDQLVYNTTNNLWVLGDNTSTSPAPFLVDLVGHDISKINIAANVSTNFLSYNLKSPMASLQNQVNVTVTDSTGKNFKLQNASDNIYVTINSLVKSAATIQPGLTYVTGKLYDGSTYTYTTAEPVQNYLSTNVVTVQKPINDSTVTPQYKVTLLNGLNITNKHTPGFDSNGAPNAEAGVKKIYGQLINEPGVFRGLTNPDMIAYRYIVDTMAYGLQPEMGGKSYLSMLAKSRGKTTAIINAPAITQFATSQNPYFCDTFVPGVDPTPVFDTTFITQGGNPDMPRSFAFSLPSDTDGATFTGVFTPFLKYNDNGRTILVPPAADVANAYVQKFLGGNPYAVVANQNGILSNPNLLGVEYDIDKTDRDNFEPFGFNSFFNEPIFKLTGKISALSVSPVFLIYIYKNFF